jgi:hypothetical protein
MSRTAEEVCIEYADAVGVARQCRRTLQVVKCDYYEKPEKADYESGYPGSAGVPKCTDPYADNENGMCGNCERDRMPALLNLREAKKRIAQAKRSVESTGKRLKSNSHLYSHRSKNV